MPPYWKQKWLKSEPRCSPRARLKLFTHRYYPLRPSRNPLERAPILLQSATRIYGRGLPKSKRASFKRVPLCGDLRRTGLRAGRRELPVEGADPQNSRLDLPRSLSKRTVSNTPLSDFLTEPTATRQPIMHHTLCLEAEVRDSDESAVLYTPLVALVSLSSAPRLSPSSATQALYIRLPLGMELTLKSFLGLLRNLLSFFRTRWDYLARRLWHIFSTFRVRLSSQNQNPKKRDDIRRIQYRPAKPSRTTVICASQLPPPLTPIVGEDSPVIASPSPVSIQVRQPTILPPEDILEESQEGNADNLDVDGYFRGGSRSITRSPDFAGYHDEPSPIHVVLPLNREESTSTSPVTPSRPNSISSYRPASQYSGFRSEWSPYSHRPPSEHSYRSPSNLNGAESAARGYLPERPSPRPSSPAPSVRAPSVAGSVTSRVYRASRLKTRVRMPSPMANAPHRGDRPSSPASVRPSVPETHPDVPVPELPQPESQTTGSAHRGRNSVTVSFGPLPALPPMGKLRPAIGIDRYQKQKQVIIEDVDRDHVCLPVTTEFSR